MLINEIFGFREYLGKQLEKDANEKTVNVIAGKA